jgi:hypothetical protein
MINFFVTRRHAYTIRPFLQTWSNRLGDKLRLVPYDQLPFVRSVAPAAYVFADLERLGPAELAAVGRLGDLISTSLHPSLVVNHPRCVLRRTDLLRTLWDRGINSYRVARSVDLDDDFPFPAFIRNPDNHNGPLTPILRNRDKHDEALGRLIAIGKRPDKLLTIQFRDTRGPDGFYRKYAAFRVGERIIPGHLLRSPNWVTKDSGPEPMRDEERAYLADNPHRDALMAIFDLSGIGFGRIDYGLRDGRIEVWEINTNPVLIQQRGKYAPDKLPVKQALVDQLSDAFSNLADRAGASAAQRVEVSGDVVHARTMTGHCQQLLRMFRKLDL